MPLNVEKLGIRTGPAPRQHILPPWVIGAAYGHMVGDEIEQQAHVVCAQFGHQSAQSVFTAQRRADAGGVDHVVTMHGAFARGQQG